VPFLVAGAWNAVFIACDLHPLDWTESYYESMELSGDALLDGYRSFVSNMLFKLLPQDAYLRCSGRVYISITTIHPFGYLTNKIVSEFESNVMRPKSTSSLY
jgi:hypothetical protein